MLSRVEFMKKKNYCFSNINCEYYPCHKGFLGKEFNCLFCYCPLYKLEKCPGNPIYRLNDKGQERKDCSECIFPHIPENYEKVVSCLREQNEILKIELFQLKKNMESHLARMSGFDHMDFEMREEHKIVAEYMYESYLKDTSVEILLQPFSKKCVGKQGFCFNQDIEISCDILERLDLEQEDIVLGYLYAFHAPELSKKLEEEYERLPLLEQCYIENWLIAVLDAGRDWIRNYLFRKNSVRHACYVTDSFGPGFYGMTIESLPKFLKMIDGEAVGITITESGNLNPLKSCVGIYLVTTKDVSHLMGHDCVNCAGNKFGCHACRN